MTTLHSQEIVFDDDACDAQGFLFAEAFREGLSVHKFAEEFLTSDFCEINVDDEYGRFHRELYPEVIIEASFGEINPVSPTSKDRYLDEETCNDIGYLYRLICELGGLTSKEVYKSIPFDSLIGYLPAANEYGFDSMAIEIIRKNHFLTDEWNKR